MIVADHLEELKHRLINIAIVVVFSFVICLVFSRAIIEWIIRDYSLGSVSIVSLGPLEYVYTQFRVAFIAAVLLSSPVIIYQMFAFIMPAVTRKERIAIYYIMPSFFLLFLSGALFSYLIFSRVALRFFAMLSGSVKNMWSIHSLVYFILVTAATFGLIFELPLVLIILKKLNIIDSNLLRRKRPHIYVALFIIAAVITPPDAITQFLVALPIIVLLELSFAVIRLI